MANRIRARSRLVPAALVGLILAFADSRWPPQERGFDAGFRALNAGPGITSEAAPVVQSNIILPIRDGFADALARWPGGFSADLSGIIRLRHPGFYHFNAPGNGRVTVTIGGCEFSEWATFQARSGFYPVRIRYDFDAARDSVPELHFEMNKEINLTRPVPTELLFPPSAPIWRFGLQWTLRGIWIPALAIALLELPVVLFGLRDRCRVWFPAVACAGSVVLFLGSAEIALRVFDIAPREYVPGDAALRSKLNVPGATMVYEGPVIGNVKEFSVPLSYNSGGWRDDEHEAAKPASRRRILLLGDSFVEGKEVPFESTFHQLVESRLNDKRGHGDPETDIIVMARGSCGTTDQLGFMREGGMDTSPDLVILSFYTGNDVTDNSPDLRREREEWFRSVYLDRIASTRVAWRDRSLLFGWSRVNRHLSDRLVDYVTSNIHLFHPDLPKEAFVPPDMAVFERGEDSAARASAWRASKDAILAVRDLARSGGAEFMLLIAHSARIPGQDPVVQKALGTDRLDLEKPVRILRDFCRENDITFIDTYPALTRHEAATGDAYYWKYDTHWNETGHEIVAGLLYDILRRRDSPDGP